MARIVLVEGPDDRNFLQALLAKAGHEDVQVLHAGGKDKLRAFIRTLPNTPGFPQVTDVGIVRDADTDAGAAFQSVGDALQLAGLPAPKGALVKVGEKVKVVVLILPGTQRPGELEDCCVDSIAGTATMKCVDELFACLTNSKLPLPKSVAKAKAHAYLATCAEAGKRVGDAANAGYWPLDHDAFKNLRDFIQVLRS